MESCDQEGCVWRCVGVRWLRGNCVVCVAPSVRRISVGGGEGGRGEGVIRLMTDSWRNLPAYEREMVMGCGLGATPHSRTCAGCYPSCTDVDLQDDCHSHKGRGRGLSVVPEGKHPWA